VHIYVHNHSEKHSFDGPYDEMEWFTKGYSSPSVKKPHQWSSSRMHKTHERESNKSQSHKLSSSGKHKNHKWGSSHHRSHKDDRKKSKKQKNEKKHKTNPKSSESSSIDFGEHSLYDGVEPNKNDYYAEKGGSDSKSDNNAHVLHMIAKANTSDYESIKASNDPCNSDDDTHTTSEVTINFLYEIDASQNERSPSSDLAALENVFSNTLQNELSQCSLRRRGLTTYYRDAQTARLGNAPRTLTSSYVLVSFSAGNYDNVVSNGKIQVRA
jgi:hypothetical protein